MGIPELDNQLRDNKFKTIPVLLTEKAVHVGLSSKVEVNVRILKENIT